MKEIGQGVYAINFAQQVRVDPQDNIWIVDAGSNQVVKFDADGRFQLVLGRKPENITLRPGPGVPASAADAAMPRRAARRPRRRAAAAVEAVAAAARPGAGINGDSFNRPSDVTWDRAGNIYVADGFGPNNRIAKFTKDGNFVKSWGQTGSGQGQFNGIRGIASDAAGNLYVADAGNKRIQVFDGEGTFKSQITNVGTPQAICISGGSTQYLFSSNSNDPESMDNGEIYKVQLSGQVVGKFGKAGKLPKEFGMVNAHRLPDRERPVGRRGLELAGAEGDAEEVSASTPVPGRSHSRAVGRPLWRSHMIRRSIGFLAGFLVLLLSAPAVLAQGGRAEINGVVSDQDKAVLPGVTVTATNEGTASKRDNGHRRRRPVRHPLAAAGPLHGEGGRWPASRPTTRNGMVLHVGQEMTAQPARWLAGVAETLTVTAEAPLVESTSSRIGTNVTSSEIDALPSANRSQFSLMQTIPGLVPTLQVGSFEGGQFSANGQATTNNLFLVDGQNDNDSRRGGSQGTQARVSLDSMAEYQVQTHQYGAEYGGSTGVVVNSVTKSGTNKLRGRVFEYYQDNKLQATDYFLKQAGEKNPDSGSNVFGGSIGGPIVQEQGCSSSSTTRGRTSSEAANLNFPAAGGAAGASVLDDDRVSRDRTRSCGSTTT